MSDDLSILHWAKKMKKGKKDNENENENDTKQDLKKKDLKM